MSSYDNTPHVTADSFHASIHLQLGRHNPLYLLPDRWAGVAAGEFLTVGGRPGSRESVKCAGPPSSCRTYHRVHAVREPRSAKRNDDQEQQIFDGRRRGGRPASYLRSVIRRT